jgi:choline kinase
VHSFPIHTHAARDTWIEVDTPEDLELAKILSEQLLRGDAGGSA